MRVSTRNRATVAALGSTPANSSTAFEPVATACTGSPASRIDCAATSSAVDPIPHYTSK